MIKRLFSALLRREAPDFKVKALLPSNSLGWIERKDFKNNTFVCPTEILAFSDRKDEFSALNTEVAGVSVDSEWSHLKWSQMDRKDGGLGPGLRIPLLSDIRKGMSLSYGVLDEEQGVSNRALFIVDPLMKVRHISMNDFSIGRSVDEVLRCLSAIQYVDKHGGSSVCPANWTTGDKAIQKAKASDYFREVNKK